MNLKLQAYASEEEDASISSDSGDYIDSDESEELSVQEEDLFRSLLARAGMELGSGTAPPCTADAAAVHVALRDRLLSDDITTGAFVGGLHACLDDPLKACFQ